MKIYVISFQPVKSNTSVESLNCMPETNITLYVNQLKLKFKTLKKFFKENKRRKFYLFILLNNFTITEIAVNIFSQTYIDLLTH